MTIVELKDYLTQRISGGVLTLDGDEKSAYAFVPLMLQTRSSRFTLDACVLTVNETYIIAEGLLTLPPLLSGEAFKASMRFEIRSGEIWYSLELNSDETMAAEAFFGSLQRGYGVSGGAITVLDYPLASIMVSSPYLYTDVDKLADQLAFRFEMNVAFSGIGAMWQPYLSWLNLAERATGVLTLFSPHYAPTGGAAYRLDVPLSTRSLPDGLFHGFIKQGSLKLCFLSGINPGSATTDEIVTRVDVVCTLQFQHIETPIEITAPLFDSPGMWNFQADFPTGLKPADLARFLLDLFGFSGAAGQLNLPPSSPLENFKLYSMYFEFWGDKTPNQIIVEAGTHQPWTLPLPFITLDLLKIQWSVIWGKGQGASEHFMSATIAAFLRVALFGGKELLFNAKARLPEMDIEASLTLNDTSTSLTDLFGNSPAAALGEERACATFASLDLYASPNRRSLTLYGMVRNVLAWNIGKINFLLEEVNARVSFAQSGNTFQIGGVFRVATGAGAFSFTLNGGYNGKAWFFNGYLSQGSVNIGSLLLGLLGIDYRGGQGGFVLTDFEVSYDTGSKLLALRAAFNDDWGISFGSLKVSVGGLITIRADGEQDKTYIAALLSLGIGSFEISAQVDDFFATPSYIFQIRYGQHALRATYAEQDVKGNKHKILSVELQNTTLGDLVLLLIHMINPNHRHDLPAPWNLLHKIDLSRFRLTYDLTDKSICFTYALNLDIPGLLSISQVGLEYARPDGESQYSLRFILTGKTLGSAAQENFGWDALKGSPPNVARKNNRFNLHYLGAGQRLGNPKLLAAIGINEAIEALKESFKLDQVNYDANINWLFGLDFTINDMLNVKLVFNDPMLYGLLVTVGANNTPLSVFAGLSLEVLYKKIGKDVGMFKSTLRLPEKFRKFQLGAVSFTIGTLSLEIYTNGDFLIDLGFPYNGNFSRSFALEAGIFSGHGGLYFGALSGATAQGLPKTTAGTFTTVVALGVGLSIGIGRSFDFGIVKGGLSLEVVGIFEGLFAVFQPKNKGDASLYYTASATVGIVGRIYISVDLEIICLYASVELSAYAKVTMIAHQPMLLDLDVSLKMSAYVKILFIKVKFSFTFNRHFNFTIGSASPAPWEQAAPAALTYAAPSFYEPVALGTLCRIGLCVVPVFSLADAQTGDSPAYCAAFIPTVGQADFRKLIAMLAEWTLCAWADTIGKEEAAELTVEAMRAVVDYNRLTEFFNLNLRLDLTALEEADTNAEIEGAVLAVPPALSLCLTREEAESEPYFQVNYSTDNLVPAAYALKIAQYFDTLNPNPNKTDVNMRKASAGQLPMAQIIFMDYIHMLLRELIGRLQSLFNEFSLDSAKLSDIEQLFGVPFARLLSDNPSLTLLGGTLSITQCPVMVFEGESISSLAERCGVSKQELSDCLRDMRQILSPGAKFTLPQGSFANNIPKITVVQLAALFFARRQEFALEGYYQKIATKLQELNPDLNLDWEETTFNGRTLTLPDNGMWHTLPGDTLERLAKMLILPELPIGTLQDWDNYRDTFIALNGGDGTAVLDVVNIPAQTLEVSADVSCGALLRRNYPDGFEQILDTPLLKPFVVLNVPLRVTVEEGSTLKQVLEATGIPLMQFAETLKKRPSMIAAGQKLRICEAAWLDKNLALEILKDEAYADEIGAAASRFMLQGLRLPNPGEILENELATQPFYALTRQQVALPEQPADWQLELTAHSDCTWLAGNASSRLPWEKIEPALPDLGFDWTQYAREFRPMDVTCAITKSYTASMSVALLSDGPSLTMHKLSAEMIHDLPKIQRTVLLKREQEEVRLAASLPFTLRRTETAGVFDLEGVAAPERDRILFLAQQAKESSLQYILCFKPNPLQVEGALFAERWDAEHCLLIRSNLSLETHRTPVVSQNVPARQDVCALGTPLFLQMLWECSVVGGGGYFLRLVTENAATLPDEVFDENGRAELNLVAYDTADARLRKNGLINAAVTGAGVQAQESGQQAVFVPDGAKDETLFIRQPSTPPGCVGLTLTLEQPHEADTRLNNTRRLFNIIEYDITGSEYRSDLPNSAPLLPEDAPGNDALWRYTAIIPAYRLTYGAGGVYAALGKTMTVAARCRDILGNRMPGILSAQITPTYNDVLIAPEQWPITHTQYKIAAESGKPKLIIEINALERSMLDNPQTAAALMRRAAEQLEDGMEVTVTTSLFNAKWSLGSAPFIAYTRALSEYLDGTNLQPPSYRVALNFPETLSSSPQPYLLSVTLEGRRTKNLPETPSLCGFSTGIEPAIEAGEEGAAERFAAQLETALPQVKLARAGVRESEWFIVPVGTGGAIEHIKIAPLNRTIQEVSVKAPGYFGISPLSNKRMGEVAEVYPLAENGRIDYESPVEKNYHLIDMDEWGGRFLQDVEAFLSASYAFNAPEATRRVVAAKDALSLCVAQQMVSIEQDFSPPINNAADLLRDRMRRSLSVNTPFAAIAQYSLDMSAGVRCRLPVQLKRKVEQSGGEPVSSLRVEAGKIDSLQNTFCLIYQSDEAARNGFSADWNIIISEMEYEIHVEENGYERSKWLQFVMPIVSSDDTVDCLLLEADLSSQISVPNPLRHCPANPDLTDQSCVFDEEVLYNWEYRLACTAEIAEQDTYHFEVEFMPIAAARLAQKPDLFTMLCRYDYIRDALATALGNTGSVAFAGAAETFAEMSESIAQSWSLWVNPAATVQALPRTSSSTVCVANVEANLSEEPAVLHTNCTWEGVQAAFEDAPSVQSGKRASFTLCVPGLSVYDYYQATPNARTIRNANLLKISGTECSAPVNPCFIYRSDTVSLPPVYAGQEVSREICIAQYASNIDNQNLKAAIDRLFERLNINGRNVVAGFVVGLAYDLNGGNQCGVELPVGMFPARSCMQEQIKAAIQDGIMGWYTLNAPIQSQVSLYFRVVISPAHQDVVMLAFNRLRIDFGISVS